MDRSFLLLEVWLWLDSLARFSHILIYSYLDIIRNHTESGYCKLQLIFRFFRHYWKILKNSFLNLDYTTSHSHFKLWTMIILVDEKFSSEQFSFSAYSIFLCLLFFHFKFLFQTKAMHGVTWLFTLVLTIYRVKSEPQVYILAENLEQVITSSTLQWVPFNGHKDVALKNAVISGHQIKERENGR